MRAEKPVERREVIVTSEQSFGASGRVADALDYCRAVSRRASAGT